LRKEGYTNVREMAPLFDCPAEDPVLDESFVAERDGLSYEIKKCCHRESYTYSCEQARIPLDEGPDIVIWGTCTSSRMVCARYARRLQAEGNR
jgi:hypothetical protein